MHRTGRTVHGVQEGREFKARCMDCDMWEEVLLSSEVKSTLGLIIWKLSLSCWF